MVGDIEEQTQFVNDDSNQISSSSSFTSRIKNNRIIQAITIVSMIIACTLLVSDNNVVGRVVTSNRKLLESTTPTLTQITRSLKKSSSKDSKYTYAPTPGDYGEETHAPSPSDFGEETHAPTPTDYSPAPSPSVISSDRPTEEPMTEEPTIQGHPSAKPTPLPEIETAEPTVQGHPSAKPTPLPEKV